MSEDLQWRLAAAFPPSTDAALIRSLNEGILLADGLLESEPFLKTLVGRDIRGHLRRAGILFRLLDACRVGDLPFQADINRMPRGNWHWLELQSGQFLAHVCRTESALAFPEDTHTRQDERFRNQSDLFEPSPVPFRELARDASQLSAWLMIGGGIAGQLHHACWGMPAADGDDWLAHIDVLRRANLSGAIVTAEPMASKSLNLRFKEHIEEALSMKRDLNTRG